MAQEAGVLSKPRGNALSSGILGSRPLHGLSRFMRKQPLGAASLGIIVIFALAALLAPVVTPYGADQRDSAMILTGPSSSHLLGTDQLGRDLLTRLVYGARLTLFIGLAVTFFSAIIGVALGVTGAYLGGKPDKALVVALDSLMAFPALILAIAIVTAAGRSTANVIIAVVIGTAPGVARIIRAQALTVRNMPYVEAARSSGCGTVRILVRHVVPNLMATVIILASLNFAGAMLAEASLSFLGLGPPPPAPSWGRMLGAEGRQFFRTAPWMLIWPGLVLAIAVYAFNLLGDSLRDFLDPRLRER